MISSKQQTQKRMLSSKAISPKNTKLASMARIANRSPNTRIENRSPITTISSKKQLLQNSQKPDLNGLASNLVKAPVVVSERQVRQVKRSAYQSNEPLRGAVYAEKNPETRAPSNVPLRYQVKPAVSKYNVEEVSQVNSLQFQKKEGSITVTLPNGDIYTGDVLNHKYNGKGEYFFKTHNLAYKGEFRDGKQHGQGLLFNPNGGEVIYDGLWEFGAKHGLGNYIYSPDEYYNGEWKNNEKEGNGFLGFRGGSYNGEWARNRATGRGNLKLTDSTEFKGRFENNEFLEGTVKYPNGDQYYGQLKNNKRNSENSSYINFGSKIRYKGGYYNDKKHGKGTIFYQTGDELTGMFRDGLLNDNEVATYRWSDGTVFQGWFKEGKPHKGTVTYPSGQKTQI